eukprot:m.197263 g.197263  ORF g.197263 m.197263 type:complete len:787 (-) comp32656_c2_seq1:40-2400(-)
MASFTANLCGLLAVAITATATAIPADRPWMDVNDAPIVRAKKLVAEMNVTEKLALFHGSCGGYTGNVCGNSRLGIPQFKYNDGPQGFRGDPGTSTSWPAALTVSTAWDVNLSLAWGVAMGEEFYQKGANVQLGPGACVARVPRNGRNFEYVSGEDPYLGSQMTGAVVTGIQSQGVVANVKHYVNNNQETNRQTISENVDERTNFEIYYPPFEAAVKVGLGSIMCSYNKICYDCGPGQIGNWSCENSDTLQTDLKDRLGFAGYVMSDWGATHSASMNRGLDQEMPGSKYMGDTLAAMVTSGEVSMAKVDDSATRILWPFFAVGLMDKPNPSTNTKANNVTSTAHNALARKIAAESAVLLKNDNNFLPLSKTTKVIAVIGDQAQNPIVHGGGSGQVTADFVVTPLAELLARFGIPPSPPVSSNCSAANWQVGIDFHNEDDQTRAPAANVAACCALCADRPDCNAFSLTKEGVCWMKKDTNDRTMNKDVTSGICTKGPTPQPVCKEDVCVYFNDGSDVESAAKLAATADAVLIFVGTTSHEGSDRSDLSLGDQDALISAVAVESGKKTAVIVVTPGAILTPWRNNVSAVVTNMMPGQQYGAAIVDVLFGDVNPSGKLALTFPNIENEVNFTESNWPGVNLSSYYGEKLEVGYRWYAAHKVTPAFGFGHGLSYTTFTYSALAIKGRSISFVVENTGSVAGAEVAQLYVKFPSAAGEPPKQLKGFQKVMLAPGSSQTIEFMLDDRSFSIWDVTTHAWTVVKGAFGVMVGASSEDIKLMGTINPMASMIAME